MATGNRRSGRPVRIRPARPPARSWLWPAADRAWRLLVVGAVVYVVFVLLGRLQLISVAVFLGLVITAVLRPLTELFARALPRGLAVAAALVGTLLLVAGLLSLIGELISSQSTSLGHEFSTGLRRIENWLERPPFKLSHTTVSNLRHKIGSFVSSHRSTLISKAVSGASRAVEVVTTGVFSLFLSVFFLHSGTRMWNWFQGQLPRSVRSNWDRGGRTAWRTFSGYTRGIFLVAATNAALVGLSLFLLRVPLALPLTLLEFVATFIPLIGSPVAMAVAAVVALATRGVVTAVIVLVLIVVIGQLEGHVLHPLVLSWAVQLHPIVVAISVLAGSVLAGIVGAVIAVPLVSVVWAVYAELRRS